MKSLRNLNKIKVFSHIFCRRKKKHFRLLRAFTFTMPVNMWFEGPFLYIFIWAWGDVQFGWSGGYCWQPKTRRRTFFHRKVPLVITSYVNKQNNYFCVLCVLSKTKNYCMRRELLCFVSLTLEGRSLGQSFLIKPHVIQQLWMVHATATFSFSVFSRDRMNF